ncbi:tyrosyl-tRNA synthetase [Vermiconidia calcicola]|uniref:Tyrosyl-tRNA synthetase n=1 Tax=Vermiconidia calcicola TaxID=1690605 RepID=A0ACC3MSL2_9PEZI|nr:tyrosyl-tRNA synthetase [Vermiconidia calcicola]
MVLFWASVYGHTAVSLVGGGTARVGDPTGRLTSRESTGADVQRSNFEAMFDQTGRLWKTAMLYAQGHGYEEEGIGEHRVLDNAEWLDKLNILDFLKMMGNGMRLGAMLGRDTVKNKMEKGDGMSFSEFTYPLLQGWDWWHMYREMNVQVQIGGSDQYGNIIAGMDAMKYIVQNHATFEGQRPPWLSDDGRIEEESMPMGLTVPLLTTASGEKFGKSAGNAIWFDKRMTSPFDLYGFLLRSTDADVERYLKLFTFVPIDGIATLMEKHGLDPGKRKAQHHLALEVLTLVHGEDVAKTTRSEHQMMRNPNLLTPSRRDDTLRSSYGSQDAATPQPEPPTANGDRTKSIMVPQSEVLDRPLGSILYAAGLADSGSHGRRLVSSGAVYLASRSQGADRELTFVQIKDPMHKVEAQMLVDGRLLVRIGKWKVRLIEVVGDEEYATIGIVER